MKDPASYPFNSPNAKFPYPQGRAYKNCPLPVYSTDSVATAYNNWKTKFYVGGRVVRPENSNDTVSEGIAYGMLIAVYMNDRSMFDTLYAYSQTKLDQNGLMHWNINSGGSVIGQNSATDAEEDMAWALLVADAQWGGTYKANAIKLIDAIWNKEVESGSNVLKPGDSFGGSSQTNPSYFAPSYYRAFAKVTSYNWNAVIDSSYTILSAASGSLGLVPNWVNAQGAGVNGPGNDSNGLAYGYDACRTPFRIALDYCMNGEPRAKAYLDKITGFFAGIATITPAQLKDGYTTTGANPNGTLGDYSAGMAFAGPGAVGALSGGHAPYLAASYTFLESYTTQTQFVSSNSYFSYYNGSWGVILAARVERQFLGLATVSSQRLTSKCR
ncbi:MAG: glycosyl hydrolase family 8 [Polyangiaceae bacterium]